MSTIHQPHDGYFKLSMRIKHVAQDFMRAHLPPDILKKMDLETLQLYPESFVKRGLERIYSDVVFTVEYENDLAYIYILLEHLREADKLMPFRVNEYSFALMRHHIDHHNTDELPIVFPLIYYNGDKPYPYSTDMFSLFGSNTDLAKKCLLSPVLLIDLHEIDDGILQQHRWASLMSLTMKHRSIRALKHMLQSHQDLVREIWQNCGDGYIISSVIYTVNESGEGHADLDEISDLLSKIDRKMGGRVMTIAEQLKAIGRAEGRAEVRAEVREEFLQTMRKHGADEKLIEILAKQESEKASA